MLISLLEEEGVDGKSINQVTPYEKLSISETKLLENYVNHEGIVL